MSIQSPDQPATESEQTKPATATEKTQELKGIAEEVQRREKAWGQYAGYGPEYQRRNDERAAVGRAKIDHFGDGVLTMVASINTEKIDPATGRRAENQRARGLIEGGAVDLHDYNPESRNHADIEAAYNEYLAITPAEERLVVFEGNERSEADTPDRDSAIDSASETGMMQYFARRDGVPAATGEPSDQDIAHYTETHGVSPEELTLVLMIRNLTHDLGKPLPDDITLQLYGEAAVNGLSGFQHIPDADKGRMIEQNPEIIEAIKAQARSLATRLNTQLEANGLPQLVLGEDGTITFASLEDRAALAKSWDPRSGGRLSDIHRVVTEARDRHIFDTITQAISEGKRPFVVYGGSHVMSLEPVMEEYFGAPDSTPSNG